MYQSQNQILRTQPQISAHLAQTMALLEMTSEEIRQEIETKLANNPALEVLDEHRCPNCGRILTQPGPCPVCTQPYDRYADEPLVFISSLEDFPNSSGNRKNHSIDKDFTSENFVAQDIDLATFVLQQVGPDLNKDERPIAAHILTHLDEDGLLSVPLIEISHFLHVPHKKVVAVAKKIQESDPLGIGSSSPKEALLAQLRVLENVMHIPSRTEDVIRTGIEDLSKRNYGKLAQKLNMSLSQVQTIGKFIRGNLNPYPARANWGDIRKGSSLSPMAYHRPDVIIRKQKNSPNNRLIVEIISPYQGTLRVNPLFQKAIQGQENSSLKNTLEQASLLIKCLQQRNTTMKQLMAKIAYKQREFLISGDFARLRPMTQASMAKSLDVHESTISRAVSDKSVQLPNNRIIPLKQFFDRSLPIRVTLKRIIANENKPLSDSELAEELANKGYEIARRTVAKYRSMEGILSSRMR
mgnify:CR=1 FL=1